MKQIALAVALGALVFVSAIAVLFATQSFLHFISPLVALGVYLIAITFMVPRAYPPGERKWVRWISGVIILAGLPIFVLAYRVVDRSSTLRDGTEPPRPLDV